jgi:SPP1 gp7 family putative phage head morphogenesis protein
MSVIALQPIKETTEDYEAIEKAIRDLFKKEIYLPLLREFVQGRPEAHRRLLRNAKLPGLQDAIQSGQITFSQGTFSGKFNSQISRELRKLGATFDRHDSTYKIRKADLPMDVRHAISSSEYKFKDKLDRIEERLSKIVPAELASKLKTEHLFDRALGRVEKDFNSSVKKIGIKVHLSDFERKKIASQWGENMQLWVKDFTEKEIKELRSNVAETLFSGNRYGSAVKTIQDSYGVTERKAKFLARQETSLLMAAFKQTRYQANGVDYYKWQCVAGSKLHPVRPAHLALKDKVYSWDDPPIVDASGARKNPQQDYNCRCFPKPLVGYTGKTGVKTSR